MVVTTSHTPSEESIDSSKRIAAELGCRWVPRGGKSIRKLAQTYKTPHIMLQADDELKLYMDVLNEDDPGNDSHHNVSVEPAPMFFHPSLSFVRVKRLMRGEGDALIECSGAERGDSILDCTAGLASDSIVFSYAVGGEGHVLAIESEPALHMLIREGLAHYKTHLPSFNEAMRRVEAKLGSHEQILKDLPDKSVDIVYFDPMFRSPIDDSSAIQPLRKLANHSPLSLEAIEQAKRVARKRIVLKEHRDDGEFERLGFNRMFRSGTKIAYGVIQL
ncbi:MAG: SAM-dependent methyltransferase [Paenibacillus sp.]|nr:SAM-dependent methyltransferase [Paenibacillus sp.]